MYNNINNTLNWEIREEKVFTGLFAHSITEIPNRKALINNATNQNISIVSKNYRTFYNREMMELVDHLCEVDGISLSHYITYGGGKRVLAVFNKPDTNFELNGWNITANPVIANSNDRTGGFIFGSAQTMIRCGNQWNSIFKEVSLRHNSNLDEFIDNVKIQLLDHNNLVQKELDSLQKFTQVEIDESIIEAAKMSVLNWGDTIDVDDLSDRRQKTWDNISQSIVSEMEDLNDSSAFGLWNGITHFLTHEKNGVGSNLFQSTSKAEKRGRKFINSLQTV